MIPLKTKNYNDMKTTTKLISLLIFFSLLSCQAKTTENTEITRLWYDQPATDWMTEALPIGNGYMGAMFFGGVETEQIQFSEGSLWSGGPGTGEAYKNGNKKEVWKYVPQVRELLNQGKMKEAHQLANRQLTGESNKNGR